ncbi:MAG: ABC transporter permease [Bacteroidetes bacterium]|nr:ABC transporter permease [Bacteroidota bacterium]
MQKNFFKIAFRNLFRQKAYSLFNLLGLSLGIACGLLLTLHIKQELSYEKSFSKHDRIYRMVSTEWSKSQPLLADELKKFFPEIKSTARISQSGGDIISTGFNTQTQAVGHPADPSMVDMFDFKAIAGDPVKALTEPGSILITKSLAQKLFGNKDPISQKIKFDDHNEAFVRAVVEDLPGNTHLQFDYLMSMSTFMRDLPAEWKNNRDWMFGWTYVEFSHPDDIIKARKRLKDFYMKYYEGMGTKKEIEESAAGGRFQPITDIHLKSDLIQEMGANSSIIYVYIFIAVEVLILLIACVNFINLFTTQALKRLKEVGLRKLLGATRKQIILQFMGEAFILTLLSGLLAILIYQISLPFYNSVTGREVSMGEIFKPVNLAIIIGIVLTVGLISGLFPAFFISNFEPIHSLKATKTPKSSANYVRKGLVVFQFVVSGLLIISTVLIYQQTQLFKNKKLGFDKDQVMIAKLYGKFKEKILKNPDVIKNEILKNPDIITVAKASNVIGDGLSVESVVPIDAPSGKQYPSVKVMRVDENYIPALNIQMKDGRNFSTAFNDSSAFILNERAAEILEMKDPVNKLVENTTMKVKGKVVGVVKDFHFASLHHQIEPLVLEYKPEWAEAMFVKIRAGKTAEAIDFMKKKVEEISPNTLFSYSFLDENIAHLYKKEDNMSSILKIFAVLAIIISSLGLFGLIAHSTETRTKEIGIRKVIGANVGNLIGLLSKDLLALVLLGNLIAWPIAWYAVNKWLQEFTYRIDIGWTVFVASAIITVLIAALTIAYHCLKTANANPVKSLRTE